MEFAKPGRPKKEKVGYTNRLIELKLFLSEVKDIIQIFDNVNLNNRQKDTKVYLQSVFASGCKF